MIYFIALTPFFKVHVLSIPNILYTIFSSLSLSNRKTFIKKINIVQNIHSKHKSFYLLKNQGTSLNEGNLSASLYLSLKFSQQNNPTY